MTFEGDKKILKFKYIDRTRRCICYNPRSGTCKEHNSRPKICQIWKCQMLNFISKLFDQPMWTGKEYYT